MIASSEYATVVLLITPQGIPLVRNSKKPEPIYWKLPGGKSDGGETAAQCAVRELAEETGVFISVKDLKLVYEEDKGDHLFVVFQATLPELPQLKKEGDEGEEIKVFTPREILDMGMEDFFPNHNKWIWPILERL